MRGVIDVVAAIIFAFEGGRAAMPAVMAGCGIGVYPPGYRFVHNLPNKPLTGYRICRILKTKEIICKIFKTLELWSLWSRERHRPEADGFYLYLS